MDIDRVKLLFFILSFLMILLIYKVSEMESIQISFVEIKPPKKIDPLSDFALYVRTFTKIKGFYKTVLVHSMRYFWTFKAPLVVVLDSTEQDRAYGEEIRKVYPFPEICYEDPPFQSHYYYKDGKKGHQLSMFYADKCFHRKYIGFVDTDTMFITMATRDQLFIDEKPVIIAQYGKAADAFWIEVSKTTKFALGQKEVFRCMSYFPVIMKVQHIVEMREYIAKVHKKDFILVFKSIAKTLFSQYNIMCNYVWYFHRDEYVFHVQLRSNDGKWNGENSPPGRHGMHYYEKVVSEEMRHPVARATIHYKYINKNYKNANVFRLILKRALCYSGGFDLCSEICKPFDRNALFKDMFEFDFIDWTWDKRCIIAQRNHTNNIAKLNQTETRRRILQGCKEVDTLFFNLKF